MNIFLCLKKRGGEVLGENCLYSVHVLNKTLIGQAGSDRRVNKTGSRGKGKENSGKQEASWPVLHRTSRSQHVACPAEKEKRR
ncbi:hypothetical protein LEMLEM_LOCUS15733 [Lemmus lemmus]